MQRLSRTRLTGSGTRFDAARSATRRLGAPFRFVVFLGLFFACVSPGGRETGERTGALSQAALGESLNTAPTAWFWYFGQTEDNVNALLGTDKRLVSVQVESTSPKLFTVAMVQNTGSYHKVWEWRSDESATTLRQRATGMNERIVDLDVYVINGVSHFAAILISNTGTDQKTWDWNAQIAGAAIDPLMHQNNTRLVALRQYTLNGTIWYAVSWVQNTGADATAWWFFNGVTPAQISGFLRDFNAFLINIQPADPNGNTFNVIMNRNNTGVCWWWYFGFSAAQVADAASANQARIFDVKTYFVNGQRLFATIMFNNTGLSCPNVTTRSYNSQRTAVSYGESILNQGNVKTGSFGKLFTLPVDDQVYAQVLYASAVPTSSGVRNVLYVATVNNSIYAFDADTSALVWGPKNFNGRFAPPSLNDVPGCRGNFSGNIGIVGTPVIDAPNLAMWFVSRTIEGPTCQWVCDASGCHGVCPPGAEQQNYATRLRGIDIRNGNELPNSPVRLAGDCSSDLTGTCRTVIALGAGSDAVSGAIPFNPYTQNQRAGLGLSNGTVYVAFAGHCDAPPYHGWVVALDTTQPRIPVVGIFNSSRNVTGNDGSDTNFNGSGIWQSGNGPAIEEFTTPGGIFAATGNGPYDPNPPMPNENNPDYGESVLNLAPGALLRQDSFTDPNWKCLNNGGCGFISGDLDLASGGPNLWNGLVFQTGKQGKVYVLEQSNMRSGPGTQNADGSGGEKQSFLAVKPDLTHPCNANRTCPNGDACAVNNPCKVGTCGSCPSGGNCCPTDTCDLPVNQCSTDSLSSHVHNGTVLWQGPARVTLYVWGENDVARAYRYNPSSGQFTVSDPTQGWLSEVNEGSIRPPPGMPAGIMSLSSNGATPGTGILWATAPYSGNAVAAVQPGVLYAFNAETLGQPLWASRAPNSPPGPDDIDNFGKYNPSTVANGKVYVASLANPNNCTTTCTASGCTGGCTAATTVKAFGLLKRGTGSQCNTGSDCATSNCVNGVCQPANCGQGLRCSNGTPCGGNNECGSNLCANGVCRAPLCSIHGTPPGQGGCPNGSFCGDANDCGSENCPNTTSICQSPSCAPHCTSGAACGANADCGSQVCRLTSACNNNGNTCCQVPGCSPTCPPNAPCSDNGNCASHACNPATNTCN